MGLAMGGDRLVAMPIDAGSLGGRKITQVAAASEQSLLLADDGSVFSLSNYASAAVPIDATNLGGRKVMQVAVGSEHSLLLADDGSVFSNGSNLAGQLGLGTNI